MQNLDIAQQKIYVISAGHLLIDKTGLILDCAVAATNIDEREMIFDMSSEIAVDLLGDRGYICSEIRKEEYQNKGINIHTPLRENMNDSRSKEFIKMINNKRMLVETVIGQLTERFNIEKVRAGDMWHLTVRIGLKLLSHTVKIISLAIPSCNLKKLCREKIAHGVK